MVQKIRIYHEQKDSIWKIFIQEFFRMTGCLVFSSVKIEEMEEQKTNKTEKSIEDFSNDGLEKHDVVIFLNMTSNNIAFAYKNACFVKTPNEKVSLDLIRKNGYEILFNQIISQVWSHENELIDFKILSQYYTDNDMFLFLYNKNIWQKVQCSVSNNIAFKNRRESFRRLFKCFASCFNFLDEYTKKRQDISAYLRYTKLFLSRKLNELDKMLEGDKVFRIQDCLARLDNLIADYPDFIMPYYLKGKFCDSDSEYLWSAEDEYWVAISKIDKLYPNSKKELAFIYSVLGGYYKETMKNLESSKKCYELGYSKDATYYYSYYELAKHMLKEKKYSIVEKLCNNYIETVLNDFRIEELMPKQQIYAIYTFELLGDSYFNSNNKNLAERSYNILLKFLKNENIFFDIKGENRIEEIKIFKENVSNIINKTMIYAKLVTCATAGGNMANAEKYNSLAKEI